MSQIRDFVLSSVESYYGVSLLELDENAEKALANFTHDPQTLLVQGSVKNGSLFLSTQVQSVLTKSVIFYKSHPQTLTEDDIGSKINMISVSSSAAESLYQVLKYIYSPLLANSNDLYSSNVFKNMSELESNLRVLAHRSGDTKNTITTIEDEVEYWRTMQDKKEASRKEREAAANYCQLFQELSEEMRSMQSSPLADMRDIVENIGALLDDVWRYTGSLYPQHRVTHVFDIVGHFICSTIQNTCSAVDLWSSDIAKDYEILNLIADSQKVIQTWTSACVSLTETYWPNYALHVWNDKSYDPVFCHNLLNRLNQIYEIRSTYSQLNKLLSVQEREELKTDELFKPFQDTNPWLCHSSAPSWEAALARFAGSLRPAEVRLTERLRPRLHHTSTRQMLYEFMRYKTLIQRPVVKHALTTELEIFVSSLISLLKTIQGQMDGDETDVKMYQPPEMSPTVQRVQWAKQAEAKVKDIESIGEQYLKEFSGCKELLSLCAQLLKDLRAMYTELYEEWSRELQAQVKNGSLQLATDKPVVEFSPNTRLMVVNYNPRLVWAELEARSLAALGFRPPAAASNLDKLCDALRHARALQQVASFHNTLGERMIPSTRPMMLQAALDLSSLVQEQKAVYWDDTEQLAKYTERLKAAVLKLETQNTYLSRQHVEIRSIVEQLLETELLSKQAEWKKKIKDIRDIIEKAEANGYKNTELWRSHWDWQLYKALECQYMQTLLSLHKHFPHVKVDLVLRGHMVRTVPPMEELRVQHYHQLRRLVSLPANFVGVSNAIDAPPIFSAIVKKHGWLGNKAVQQLESALLSVEHACESWTRRASLACVADLQALCALHLKEPLDWENNFKACKAYGQAIAKMSFEDEKIEWISLGTATLRRELEAQARHLWGCLMTSLQASCRDDAAEVETFLANAILMLENKDMPKNSKELAEISAKQKALQDKMPEMEKLVENMKRKGHMLRTWGGDPTADATLREWGRVRELMLSQQQVFEQQADIVKSSLNVEWDNLNTTVDAWLSRWVTTRSRYEGTSEAKYQDMADRCRSVYEAIAQWETYVTEKDDLLNECTKFDMKLELSGTWKEGSDLMQEDAKLWAKFKDYNDEFESIANQEWIVFQKKLHLLDEFTSKWKGLLEPYTNVTLFIQQQLDRYTDLTPLLKYLKGTDFTERHWREVFNLLNIEHKKADALLFRDLLEVAGDIKRNVKELQKISAAATSESAIRSALNELELWFAGARLNITYYNDKSKRPTPIVKDYKDILTQIEQQQWVVAAVGGQGGSDACATWERRLRIVQTLLQHAHHAQRRSVCTSV